MPALTGAPVTAGAPVGPVTPSVGPVAVNVQSVAAAVPPSSFTTCFTNVNDAAASSFVIVHVADSPNASATESASVCVPPTHDHADAA